MERSRSLSLKQFFCLPLKNEVIEEDTAPVSVLISQDLQHEGQGAIEPIREVSSVFTFPPKYTNSLLQHVVKCEGCVRFPKSCTTTVVNISHEISIVILH